MLKVCTEDCNLLVCSVNKISNNISRNESMNKTYVEEVSLCFYVTYSLIVFKKYHH
jgi:hypothetical protein